MNGYQLNNGLCPIAWKAQENVQTASGEHSKWKRELWYASKGTPRLRLYFCSVTAEVI